MELLAGATESADAEVQAKVEQDLGRILDAQRMVSLDTLFQLADHIEAIGKGAKLNTALINKLTANISEIQLPRSSLSSTEKNAMGFGYWTDKHIDAERKLNLRAAIEKAGGNPEKLSEVRGLHGAYPARYAGGLQLRLLCSPRSADPDHQPAVCPEPRLHGYAGHVAHVARHRIVRHGLAFECRRPAGGSLATLPYALAEAEQNFLIPTQTQALIWGDLVPQMMLSAKIPAVVERHARPDSLGGAAPALRP